jgi:hypothetical protein
LIEVETTWSGALTGLALRVVVTWRVEAERQIRHRATVLNNTLP